MTTYTRMAMFSATLILGLGFIFAAHWFGAALAVLLGLVWLIGQLRAAAWGPTFGLVSFVATAAWGVGQQVGPGWLLAGVVAALAAWDLDRFTQRVRQAGMVADEAALTRQHLRRLAPVLAIGLLAGGLALGVTIELSFALILFLGLLVIFGLSRAIGVLRRRSN